MTLTQIPGVRVGHWTDSAALTGVTVMVFPEPNVCVVDVRGGAPGTRETALLQPGMKVETVNAIVFSGGSAFGLSAADGVTEAAAEAGVGHQTLAGPVPIVPAAILFDLLVGDPSRRPGPAEGREAYDAASDAPVATGSVGAGVGALVAGWRGFDAAKRGGVGSAAVEIGDGVVAALAVVNAVGDVFTLEGTPLTGGSPVPDPSAGPQRVMESTTLVTVATNLRFDRSDLTRLAIRAHDAMAVCVRPAHTRYDGDSVFAVSCGEAEGSLDAAMEAAFVAVGRSIESAITSAGPMSDLGQWPSDLVAPTLRDAAIDRQPVSSDVATPSGQLTIQRTNDDTSRLAALSVEAASCTRCRLAEGRTNVVFGVGNPRADLMFVGEAPGQREDEQGEPFVGKSGQLLDQLLGEIGLSRTDVYIANVVKCRPPNNRDPKADEIDACKGYLREQLKLIDPRVVVTLGNFASKLLLDTTVGITRLRGQSYDWWRRSLVPTYHPAAALRGRPQVLEEMRRDFGMVADLLAVDAAPA